MVTQLSCIIHCAAAGQSLCDSKFRRSVQKKVSYRAPESGWPPSDSSWQCYYVLGTTTKLSMPFQVFERNILLRLRCRD